MQARPAFEQEQYPGRIHAAEERCVPAKSQSDHGGVRLSQIQRRTHWKRCERLCFSGGSMKVDSRFTDFKVADLALADGGRKEVATAESEVRALMGIGQEYAWPQPLK